ncbi:MAG: hypothetical protein RMK19_02850 [Bacteroidia bacterium]|nr:hypothetical protein [Bacteroidia bacterium]MDW8014930.1 hypothetical protein [Bacteroidia bacterium]
MADIGLLWCVSEESPRLEYVLRVLCQEWLQIPYKVVRAKAYQPHQKPTGWRVIAYGPEPIPETDLEIPYTGFITRTGTAWMLPPWNEGGFFPSEGDFPWDLPAMAFYVLTLYPLYQWAYGYDEWGLYAWDRAPFYRAPFWNEPFVLLRWYELLARLGLNVPRPPFTWEVGWDIDHLYAWKGRKGLRWIGGGVWRGNLCQRLRVRYGGERDPYDTISAITAHFSPAHSRFFFLLSNTHPRDNQKPPKQPDLRQTIRSLVERGYSVGLHPSFTTRDAPLRLKKEKALLETYAGQSIRESRQHYLRFWMPSTFQNLSEAGIEEDFTLAFPKRSGFLLGTTLSVPFYRVDKEKELPLRLWSPVLMDRVYVQGEVAFSSPKEDRTIGPPPELTEEIKRLLRVGAQVGGRLHFIWHNSTWNSFPLEVFRE